jgi:hypothetical protein
MRLFRSARWLLLALFVSLIPASSYAGIFISVNFGPPVLPVYVQPPCPAPDLVWTPGYWHYGEMGYYWVPGAWVPAPFIGGLWTPGYWGYVGGIYRFNPGYWGYHVGYYGGVNYGGGYLGIGFAGGEWRGGHLAYNTSVVNVNTTIIHTTYIDRTVIETHTVANPNHVAYAGGPGGIQHTAAPEEHLADHETHTPPTSFQAQHQTTASTDKGSWAKNNGGKPTTLAVAKPLPVENHPAPPKTPVAASASKVTPGTGAPKTTTPPTTTHPNSTPGSPAGPTGSHPTPSKTVTPTTHNPATNMPPKTNTPPKPMTAPHTTSAPPKAPPPPPKPKPEGHGK